MITEKTPARTVDEYSEILASAGNRVDYQTAAALGTIKGIARYARGLSAQEILAEILKVAEAHDRFMES